MSLSFGISLGQTDRHKKKPTDRKSDEQTANEHTHRYTGSKKHIERQSERKKQTDDRQTDRDRQAETGRQL